MHWQSMLKNQEWSSEAQKIVDGTHGIQCKLFTEGSLVPKVLAVYLK